MSKHGDKIFSNKKLMVRLVYLDYFEIKIFPGILGRIRRSNFFLWSILNTHILPIGTTLKTRTVRSIVHVE